jgi:hypothetical protein
MHAWQRAMQVPRTQMRFLGDPTGDLALLLGARDEDPSIGMHCRRFIAVMSSGVVEYLAVEHSVDAVDVRVCVSERRLPFPVVHVLFRSCQRLRHPCLVVCCLLLMLSRFNVNHGWTMPCVVRAGI